MPLPFEWKLWALVNGLPALAGGLLFTGAPLVRRLFPRLAAAPWDWIGRFDSKFAWDIARRRSALLLGVGYVFRGLLFVQVLLAATWPDIRWITWGNVAFAAVLLVVTLVCGDFFHWRRPSAAGWLFLYIEEPVWMLPLIPATKAGTTTVVPEGLPILLIGLLLVQAGVMALIAVYTFFRVAAPPDVISPRVLSGFAFGWAFWSLSLAFASSWHEAQWGLTLDAFWLAGSVVILVLYRRRPISGQSKMGTAVA
jgi:hypothetical protein